MSKTNRIDLFATTAKKIPTLVVGSNLMVRYVDVIVPVVILARSKRLTRFAHQYLARRKSRLYNCCQNFITKQSELYRD